MRQLQLLIITLTVCTTLTANAQFKNLMHQADSSLKAMRSPAHKADTSRVPGSAATNGQTGSAATGHTGHTGSPATAGITLPDMTGGIKDALEKGLVDGANQVSAPDGFLKNLSIKLLFPPEARQAEKALRSLGMNKLCDDVIISMNRAAEDATKKAIPIFLDAIRHLSIKDAEGILAGPDNSATQYFQNTTNIALSAAFRPVIDSSLRKVKADKYYTEAATAYNRIPFIPHKMTADLTLYATQKATEGLFKTIAQEELKIRTQTGARSTPLMRKVFGYFQKH